MRIECPGCAARYEVPDERLSPDRSVRCARCGTLWAPIAGVSAEAASAPSARLASAALAEDLAVPEPAGEPRPRNHPFTAQGPRFAPDRPGSAPEPPPAPPPTRVVLAAWAISVLLMLALIAAAYVWRGAIMEAWPPSLRVYRAIGLG